MTSGRYTGCIAGWPHKLVPITSDCSRRDGGYAACMKSIKPDPVDVFVGRQIQIFRMGAGLSQADLSKQIGVTFQQLKKYEKAENRVSASRLFAISIALNRPLSSFFPLGREVALAPELDLTSMMPLHAAWLDLDMARRRMIINLAEALCGRI